MKSDRAEMRAHYDFSGATGSKYASRLTEQEREDLLRRSASLDARAWFGYAIQRVQELEARERAGVAEVVNRLTKTAEEASALGTSLRATIEAQLADAGLSSAEAQKRTDEVIQRWLVA